MNLTGQPVYSKATRAMPSKPMRRAAREQSCTLRLPCCNADPATTVLAHIRRFGWAGTAQKPPDFLAVFACSACHDALDGRADAGLWGFEDLLRALGETLIRQHEAGNLTMKGATDDPR